MKLNELLRDIPLKEMTAQGDLEIRDIQYDSRKVQPGDLFVAVQGMQSDGHKFIPMAVQKGAAAVLCMQKPGEDVPYILVDDSRLALALTAAAYYGYPSRELVMIGVTGTNGKTTSTTLIKHVIEKCLGKKCGLIGTIANMIGDEVVPTERTTPESYELQHLLRRMVDAGCEYAVMEVSSHALELDRVAGIRFRVGSFTNLTQDHLDFHGTMENYAAAKAKLFSICDKAAVNMDDKWSAYMCKAAACPVLPYGIGPAEEGLRAEHVKFAPSGVEFDAVMNGERVPVSLAIPGRFSVSNALTVISAAYLLGISVSDCAEALKTETGVKGRVEVVPGTKDYTIVIDYAHTPDALEKVLQTMRGVAVGRVVALFGCGGDRDPIKRPIMAKAAADNADFTVITSDNPRTENPNRIIEDIVPGMPEGADYIVIPDRREAIAWAMDNHRTNDIIVLAGKGHETYQEINGVKHHMDEREIVAEHLRDMGV